jgi:hypothetical protein
MRVADLRDAIRGLPSRDEVFKRRVLPTMNADLISLKTELTQPS